MIISKEFIKNLKPSKYKYDYWLSCNEPDLAKFMLRAHEDGNSDWAHWLFTRSVSIDNRVRYAIFSAELVLPIFEQAYPDDNRPRLAIQAAKNWLEHPTDENAEAAVKVATKTSWDAATDAAIVVDDAATDAAIVVDDAKAAWASAWTASKTAFTAWAASENDDKVSSGSAEDAVRGAGAASENADRDDVDLEIIQYGISIL